MSSILTLKVLRVNAEYCKACQGCTYTTRGMQRVCKELLICAKLDVFQQPVTTASNFLHLKIVMYVEERRYGQDLMSLRWPYKPPNARNYTQHQHASKSKVCEWSLTYCGHCIWAHGMVLRRHEIFISLRE